MPIGKKKVTTQSKNSGYNGNKSKNKPILEVEINIDDKTVERCFIYKGETAESVSQKIVEKYNLNNEEKQVVFEQLANYF